MKNLLLLFLTFNISLNSFSEKQFSLAPKSKVEVLINLIVSDIKITDSNFDTFEYQKTFVTEAPIINNDAYILDEGKTLKFNAKKLNIIIEDNNGKETFSLPANMTKKLIEYLEIGHAEEPFDCACFVHFINDMPYAFDEASLKNWKISWLRSEDNLVPGQTVMVGKAIPFSVEWKHLAIYIGKGLYISKFGTSDTLRIMNSSNMQKAFGGDCLLRMEKVRSFPYMDFNSFIEQLYTKYNHNELFDKLERIRNKYKKSA